MLCNANTPTYHRASIQLHTRIYLKQHTGLLDVSREGSASASQVERTPGRPTLTYWVVGPLHSYTHEGWVDNNNRDIGLYDVPMLMSLLGLGTGMMLANFHTCGILLSVALYMFVRYFSPSLPMCLWCFMVMLSGPVELLFLLLLIAAWTCSVVMCI